MGSKAVILWESHAKWSVEDFELDLPVQATGGDLRARANTIEGGTSEVMRNILGERVLGLPRG